MRGALLKGRFKISAEITAKLIEHPVLLPTKRGAVTGGRKEVILFFGREKVIFPRDVFLRLCVPVDKEAKDLMRRLIDES